MTVITIIMIIIIMMIMTIIIIIIMIITIIIIMIIVIIIIINLLIKRFFREPSSVYRCAQFINIHSLIAICTLFQIISSIKQ